MKFSELKDELRHLEYEAYIWKREAERWKEIAENVHMESIQVKQFNEELICRAMWAARRYSPSTAFLVENVHMESIQVKQFNEELICRAQEPWKRVTLDDRSL